MSKVITFSRTFPFYHPRKGEPTYFVEKIHKSIGGKYSKDFPEPEELNFDAGYFLECEPKHHTIRAGHHFKVGNWFSPRVWSGKPYHSKQIIVAPDIQVKKVWDFEMKPALWADECTYKVNGIEIDSKTIKEIAKNDGLDITDFIFWFAGQNIASSNRKSFSGQIICWNESLDY